MAALPPVTRTLFPFNPNSISIPPIVLTIEKMGLRERFGLYTRDILRQNAREPTRRPAGYRSDSDGPVARRRAPVSPAAGSALAQAVKELGVIAASRRNSRPKWAWS